MRLRLRIGPQPRLKARLTPVFPTKVDGEGGIAVERNGGVYNIVPKWDALALASAINASHMQVWVRDDTDSTYKRVALSTLLESLTAPIFVQDAAPPTSSTEGSIWIDADSADLDVYRLTAGVWVDTGADLKGPQGPQGEKGDTGDTTLPGRLGPVCQAITDWNDATENGFYMGSSAANAPDSGWWMGYVINHGGSGWRTQRVWGFSDNGPADTKTWERECDDGTYGSWYRILSSEAELDARYGSWTIRQQIFTASGTYTPDANLIVAHVSMVGAGGGGSALAGATGNALGSGGGGAGEHSTKYLTPADIGVSKAVTIGAAGAGGSAGNNAGSDGGDTSLGSLVVAKGGKGGGASVRRHGGLGGTGGTGTITAPGAPGGSANDASTVNLGALSGPGGSGPYGAGGLAVYVGGNSAVNGNNGVGKGSGGSGAAVYNVNSNAAGGNGTAGYVIVTEYCSA